MHISNLWLAVSSVNGRGRQAFSKKYIENVDHFWHAAEGGAPDKRPP